MPYRQLINQTCILTNFLKSLNLSDALVNLTTVWSLAVKLPILCRSTSSAKPPYLHFRCVAAFMAGAASQAGDADSSRAPGLTSGFHGSVNIHRGAQLLVPQ